MIKEYILQNWALILLLTAFVILLKTTVFLEKKVIKRMIFLIAVIFVLSVSVFFEFYLDKIGQMRELRMVLMSLRYSATPFIIAMILFTLVKKARWHVFIPAIALTVVNVISIFTGIVFGLSESGELQRGPLGYLPFIAVGAYSFFLVFVLIRQSNKQATEIIPIVFLSFAFVTGLILPFVLGKDYSVIFCTTIAIALFVYYVFSILQQTKKDALTGLLNRHAYYAELADNPKDITALVSIDMNGLKRVNDTGGHDAGDEAILTLAMCFMRAAKSRQLVYRVGGDEFVIVCRKTDESDVKQLIERIEKNVSATVYSCSIGYSYSPDGSKTIDQMLKESDEMMYEQKARHYRENGNETKASKISPAPAETTETQR